MRTQPLADRLRPTDFASFVGQPHLVGAGGALTKLLAADHLPSIILWGPPGVGKTTLAKLIAGMADAEFMPFSAVTSGIADLRKAITFAEQNTRLRRKTVLFIDEIHRWNKAQQDALLPHVESGTITLIGATTENPSFEVVGPLLSRAQVYRLEALSPEELEKILNRAISELEKGGGKKKLAPDATRFLLDIADGDARMLLNTLEATWALPEKTVSRELLEQVLTKKALHYDKKEEEHYNVISAFIKSMRGSDPDAAVYYLARMLEAGEDPIFIARRMVVFASEDVGNADPDALPLAIAAFEAARMIGMPEARINLSQAATYLASAPKSNAAYRAIENARAEVRNSGTLPVPLHLRNPVTKLMKQESYGKGYEYAHSQQDAAVSHSHLPEKLVGKRFYEPGTRGFEERIKKTLERFTSQRSQAAPRTPVSRETKRPPASE
ncbi:MAG: replication-associated recombination protein A [bacterium]|nr:replication-associated recombination protein A [bacterium]